VKNVSQLPDGLMCDPMKDGMWIEIYK
jgi:hypothetical protein